MSPALLTEMPELVTRIDAVHDEEAVGAVECGQVEAGGEAAGLAEDHVAFTVHGVAVRFGAPMIRSSKPSPLTSPALLTEMPENVMPHRCR